MARIEQVIDDLTGETLSESVEPTTITVDGNKYTVDLGSASKERLINWLNGDGSLVKATPQAAATKRAGSRKTETHGHDYAKVKAWAIANGIKAANGNPITEKTPRIGQSVYDAYHEQHRAK